MVCILGYMTKSDYFCAVFKANMQVNSPIQLYPMMRLVVPMILGIAVADMWMDDYRLWFGVMLLSFIIVVMLRNKPLWQTTVMMIFFFIFGGWDSSYQHHAEEVMWPRAQMEYQAAVVGQPVVRNKVVECDLRLAAEGSPLVKAYILKDANSKKIKLGDGITALSEIQKPYNRYPNSKFDYARYLRVHGYQGTTFIYKTDWCPDEVSLEKLSLLERTKLQFMMWRAHLLDYYRRVGFDGQQYAVLAALTLGEKSNISKDVKDEYSQAGASHILALSGLHLGIIFVVLTWIFPKRRFKILSTIAIISSIWMFVFLSGVSPSVVRAAVMLTIYAMVEMLNRDKISLNTLALAAFVMLVANPMNLYDVGFELSFVAVLSIVLFYEPINGLISRRYFLLNKVWSLVAVSTAAQIGTFPLVIYYFGRFPVYFLLTNMLVVPAATLALYSTILMMALTPIPVVQSIVAMVPAYIVEVMNNGVRWVNRLPGSTIEGLHPTSLIVMMIYVVILTLYSFSVKHTYRRLELSLGSVLLLLVVCLLGLL
jgi:competence protein ComEC